MVETVRLYLPVSPVRLRDDEGIVPYAEGRFLPLNLAQPSSFGVPPHTRQGLRPATLSQERVFRASTGFPAGYSG